jgi:hypothetical protein
MIFTLLITSGNGAREPWVDEEHVKCTAHQIPNEFRIAYSARGNRVEPGCLPRGRRAQYFLRCATDHPSTQV